MLLLLVAVNCSCNNYLDCRKLLHIQWIDRNTEHDCSADKSLGIEMMRLRQCHTVRSNRDRNGAEKCARCRSCRDTVGGGSSRSQLSMNWLETETNLNCWKGKFFFKH